MLLAATRPPYNCIRSLIVKKVSSLDQQWNKTLSFNFQNFFGLSKGRAELDFETMTVEPR